MFMSMHGVGSIVEESIKKHCDSEYVTPEQLKDVLTESINETLESRDFQRLVREIIKDSQK